MTVQSMTPWARRRSAGGDDGFSTVEVVLLAPVFVLALLLVVVLGRVQQANADLTGAARDGARAASLARSVPEARVAGEQAVRSALSAQALECQGGANTTIDTGDFVPGGQVEVSIRCVVELSDIGFTAMPGSTSLTRSSVSPIDTFRAP